MGDFGDAVTDWISRWTGSWSCVWLHSAWFGGWWALRLDVDVLTMVVSLEAIFLCIFLLMAQNRADIQRQKLFDAIAQHTDQIASHTEAMASHFSETHLLVQEVRSVCECRA